MKKINSYTVHELGVSDIKFNETNVLMTAGYDKQIKLWILTKKTFKIFSRIDLNFFPCEIADYTASADLKQFVITYVAKHAIERITLTVTPQQNSWTHTWIETDSFKYLF